MQHGACARFGELDKTRFREALLEQELGGLRYIGQIRLGGSLADPCIPTNFLVDQLPLRGRWKGFTSRTSVSSSITHRCVGFVFASFFSTSLPFILLLCYHAYGLEQLVCLSSRIYSIPHLILSQSKINRIVTLIWESKQLLCFHTFQSIQKVMN